MDLSSRVDQIAVSNARVRALLAQRRFVVCFGQRATICFAVAGPLSTADVVGAFTTADEALACLAERPVDFLLCGDQLEQGCGMALVATAKQQWPQLRTLLLVSGKSAAASIREAIAAGCDGLLLDTSLGVGTASDAVATICGGGIVIDRALVEQLKPSQPTPQEGLIQPLSNREHQVLSLLAHGHNNAEIAERLVISIDTVKSHLKNVLLKLSARGRTHAAVLALQLGLVDWPAAADGR
ncbi:MAG: response regulator transcription factor [Cyanobacteriota bacterium]|nr:response regulator transcription factor [Cyanobacteriota bacterium]